MLVWGRGGRERRRALLTGEMVTWIDGRETSARQVAGSYSVLQIGQNKQRADGRRCASGCG